MTPATVQGGEVPDPPVLRGRRLLRAGASLLSGQVAYRAGTAVYSIVVVRYLTQASYGDFALGVAVIAISAAIADGGVTRLLTRDVALADQHRTTLVRGLLLTRLLWGTLWLPVLVVLDLTVITPAGSTGWFIALTVVGAGVEASATGLESAGVGTGRLGRVVGGQVLGAAGLAGSLLFVASNPTLPAALGGFLVGATLRLGWNYGHWHRELRTVRGVPSWPEASAWVRQAGPFLVIALLGAIYYRLDIVILQSLRGSVEAAPYAAAYRVVDAAIVIGGAIVSATVPHLSRAYRDSPEDMWRLWRSCCLALGATGAILSVATFAAAPEIAGAVFGSAYRHDAGLILRLLAPSVALTVLQSVNAAFLFAGSGERSLALLSVVHVCVNASLTVILVNAHGAPGAAAATSASTLFTFVYFALIVRRRVRVDV